MAAKSPAKSKPATVNLRLRMRVDLMRELEKAAEKGHRPVASEILRRLEVSLQQDTVKDLVGEATKAAVEEIERRRQLSFAADNPLVKLARTLAADPVYRNDPVVKLYLKQEGKQGDADTEQALNEIERLLTADPPQPRKQGRKAKEG